MSWQSWHTSASFGNLGLDRGAKADRGDTQRSPLVTGKQGCTCGLPTYNYVGIFCAVSFVAVCMSPQYVS
jgi:hypothetical protein